MSSKPRGASRRQLRARGSSLLLIDCGNTRLKWARCHPPQPAAAPFEATGALELHPLRRSGSRLLEVLRSCPPGTQTHVCNVAGVEVGRQVASLIARAGLPAPRFARSVAAAAGIHNAYSEPWRLGVDRWVAMIGARACFPGRPLCLVAVGSALTVDLLSAAGRHRGGCIVPGPSMMIEALLQRTAGIRARARLGQALLRRWPQGSVAPPRPRLFARDTRAALLGGAAHAGAALVEHAMREARRSLHVEPRLLLGGGAAELIGALLHTPFERADELVLRGLAVLAGLDGAHSAERATPAVR